MRPLIHLKGRGLLYAAGAVLIFTGIAVSGAWRPLDYWIFDKLFLRGAPPPLRELILLDVSYDRSAVEDRDFTVFRQRVGATLQALAERAAASGTAPRAVVLDFAFVKPADRGVDSLVSAIKSLRVAAKSTRIFGVVSPWKENTTDLDADFTLRHIPEIYELLDGAGHTLLEQFGPILKYEPRIVLPDSRQGGTSTLQALPVQLAEILFRLSPDADPGTLLVPLGNANTFATVAIPFASAQSSEIRGVPLEKLPLSDAIVVLGNLGADVENPYGRPGPELLAWAISDLAVHERNRVTRYPINSPLLMLSATAILSLLTMVAFDLFLRQALNRAGLERTTACLMIAFLGSVAATLTLLAMLATALLIADRILPVTLAGIGILLASGVSWLAADYRLAQARGDPKRFMRAFPQRFGYDVFVSYSREASNAAWVEAMVVAPLRKALAADGKPLRIFFDKEEIIPGERWEDKILASLASSKVFLAVFSSDYFQKEYCKLECNMVSVLQQAQRGPLLFLPLLRDAEAVPDEYRGLQYLDAADTANFIERALIQIQAAVAKPH